MSRAEHIPAVTFHGRTGAVENAFRYSLDYVLIDAERPVTAPRLFGRNRALPFSVRDADHGGAPGAGEGAPWARRAFEVAGIAPARVRLLTQPRVLGHVFNPVSFWLAEDAGGALVAVIAEVSNTYGDRHSYLCHRGGAAIGPGDRMEAAKVFHVSPFQEVEGRYAFRFDVRPDRVHIVIDYARGDERLHTTLTGPRRPLTDRAILAALVRRPFGARRVLGLIHWQAAVLWWKGAPFRSRPEPPADELS